MEDIDNAKNNESEPKNDDEVVKEFEDDLDSLFKLLEWDE